MGSVSFSGPSPGRGLAVLLMMILGVGWLASRVETGEDEMVGKLGRIEVTARLVESPSQFPMLGAYRYTYTVKYEVLKVHRQDPEGKYRLQPGNIIFVGHYKPWMPRARIKDADWGEDPLGGKLTQIANGQAHRMALDYELQDWAPSGVLDYMYPPNTNRFFALWVNPASF